MKSVIFAFPSNEALAGQFISRLNYEKGDFIFRQFPDEESYLKIETDVRNRNIIIICTLDRPDKKILPLFFMTETLKKLGAGKVILVAPYLAYMRQDKQFHPGESVTSEHFAKLISSFADGLITIDPHLHRRHSLAEIYSIPTKVMHAAGHISKWIRENVKNPVLIGPDGESAQWVSEVAKEAEAPFTVLTKERMGDEKVKVSIPHLEQYRSKYTPVLIDDIISTGHTMIETIKHLKNEHMSSPVCVGVHAVFANTAYQDILKSGAKEVVTCNTIAHVSNAINIGELLLNELHGLLIN